LNSGTKAFLFWRSGFRDQPTILLQRGSSKISKRKNTRPKSPEKDYPLVSIIIPHWNGVDVLAECLESLHKCTYPNFEIIIVDNASSDGSPDWIEKNHPEVKLVRCDKNHGYAGGCNRGVPVAQGEYLLFLNNDTIHDPGWIDPLVDTLDQDSTIAAVQSKLLNYYERDLLDYAGGCGGMMDILCFPFARGRLFLTQERDKGQYDGKTRIFWASGTAFMTRKSLFDEVGGFDEVFFAHQEEVDLQWRMQLMGYQIFVNTESLVYHKNAVSLPMHSPRKKYLNHRNTLIMMLTNFNWPLMLYLLPIRLVLELVAVLYAAALFDFAHIGAIFKSLLWILTHPVILDVEK
jgi:GT2 family glycosyltransferase